MGIFDQVVDAIVDEMELPRDGESILRKAAENPQDFDYLAGALSASPDAVREALDKEPAALTVEGFAADLGVDPEDVTRVLWTKARFREDMEADSLDLVGLIMSFETLAEDEYGLTMEIPDEEAQKIGTVEEAVAYLEKVLGEAGVEV